MKKNYSYASLTLWTEKKIVIVNFLYTILELQEITSLRAGNNNESHEESDNVCQILQHTLNKIPNQDETIKVGDSSPWMEWLIDLAKTL